MINQSFDMPEYRSTYRKYFVLGSVSKIPGKMNRLGG